MQTVLGKGVMDTFRKLATTTTLAVGLNLLGLSMAMLCSHSSFLGNTALSNFDDEIIKIAEYEPKDNGGPKSGEDAGTHCKEDLKGGPA